MPHADPDLLALLALGEDAGSVDDQRHLRECAECRSTLDELRAVVAVGRDVSAVDRPEDPPPRVWAGIRSQLRLSGPDPLAPASSAHPPSPPPAPPQAAVVPLEQAGTRRRRGWQRPVLLVAAASAGIGLGVAATLLAVDRTPDAGTVVATVDLAPLPAWDATGTATVVRTPAGQRLLEVEVSGAQQAAGFREVWLIDSDVTRLVSLGVLDGATGTFAIPEGVDLAVYPVVDVSQEPLDGDPAHSGDSIVRGTLA